MTSHSTERPAPRAVRTWLGCILAMVFGMVILGGTTRLTGSGLSMVEWHPLMGALPPLGEEAWNEVFDRYKTSPQYLLVNDWMDLASFQRIFFWEYVHRLFGRTIGLVVLLPFLFFLAKGQLPTPLPWRVFVAFVLGGLQGLMGWYMVSSGLVDVPQVSHLRLAAHLLLAYGLAQWVLWILLDLRFAGRARAELGRGLRRGLLLLSCLIVLQIAYGAFMAGTRAGYLSATFPSMNGAYSPESFLTEDGLLRDLVHAPLMIHYVHRLLGFLVLFATLLVVGLAWRCKPTGALRKGLLTLSHGMLLQFLLGILTVTLHVPILIAVTHQALALVLLCACTLILHRSR